MILKVHRLEVTWLRGYQSHVRPNCQSDICDWDLNHASIMPLARLKYTPSTL